MNRLSRWLRRGWLPVLVVAFAAMTPLGAMAEMLVTAVEGPADKIKVSRQQQTIKVQVLLLLRPGDSVVVSDPRTRLTLMDADKQSIVVDAGNSPFVVPAAKKQGWIDSATRVALDWYAGLKESQTQAAALVTRGGPPLSLLGMERGENLLAEGISGIHVTWQSGKPPYEIELLDSAREVLLAAETTEQRYQVTGLKLLPGAYRIVVVAKGGIDPETTERVIRVVPPTELPAAVQTLRAQALPAGLRSDLIAIMMASQPGWRFASLQRAMASEDPLLFSELLDAPLPIY